MKSIAARSGKRATDRSSISPITRGSVGNGTPYPQSARSPGGGDNLYQFISPMPVAWATPDATVLRRLTKEIPAGEWETLRQNLDRVGEVSASPANLVPLD